MFTQSFMLTITILMSQSIMGCHDDQLVYLAPQARNQVTSLMIAVQEDNKSKVRFVLEQGGNVNAKNSQGESVLDIAMKYNASDAIVQMLKDAGAVTSSKQ